MRLRTTIFLVILAFSCFITAGCLDDIADDGDYRAPQAELTLKKNDAMYKLNPAQLSLDGVTPQEKKPFTLIIYMNGTDLEAENGCATEDLKEIAGAEVDSSKINIIVLTGGTKKWDNDVVNSKKTMLYSMDNGEMTEVATFGKALISNPSTLTAAINFSMTAFPADRYGLIFWNHGGGPIYGYGNDQMAKNDHNALSILDIRNALQNSMFAHTKAEFIGFDACLMATLETAELIQNYAHYMVASEELEPGFGWNYSWLTALSDNPAANFEEIGKSIVDKFVAVCDYEYDDGTLSVIDLTKVQPLAQAVNNLSQQTDGSITGNNKKQVKKYLKMRRKMKAFGDLGDDGGFDVVDVGSYAEQFSEVYKPQSEAVKNALKDAIVYCRSSENIKKSTGLTIYSPYLTLGDEARACSHIYNTFGVMSAHAKLIADIARQGRTPRYSGNGSNDGYSRATTKAASSGNAFTVALGSDIENVAEARFVLWRQLEPKSDYFIRLAVIDDIDLPEDGNLQASFKGYWVTYGGQPLALRLRDKDEKSKTATYTAPAYLNDKKVTLVILQNEKNKYGKIMYAVPVEGSEGSHMAAKTFIKLKKGDKITPRYWANLFLKNPADIGKYNNVTHKWVKGSEVTVESDTSLKSEPVGNEQYLMNFWITDLDGNNYYTKGLEVTY